jgi:four helix bundle protein
MATFRHFSDIQAWKEARGLARTVYEVTALPEMSRDYALRDQLRRAAISVMNDIAEGFARGSDSQFAHFLDIARGSAAEIESMLFLLEDIAPALTHQIPPLKKRIDLILSLIAKLTTYLRSSSVRELDAEYSANETSGLPDSRTPGP